MFHLLRLLLLGVFLQWRALGSCTSNIPRRERCTAKKSPRVDAAFEKSDKPQRAITSAASTVVATRLLCSGRQTTKPGHDSSRLTTDSPPAA
jgi:hypothetical protein